MFFHGENKHKVARMNYFSVSILCHQKKKPLAILRRLKVKLCATSDRIDSEMSDQISEFIADVEKSPGISVLGFMELNKDSATTVRHH